MIDVSKYEKIGEYRDGAMIWLSPKKDNIVYLLLIGSEFYVGSAKNIHRRFSQYVSALTKGKYEAKKVQESFDKIKSFILYAIEFTSPENLRKREEYYLATLHPSLNTREFANDTYKHSHNTPKRKKTKPKAADCKLTIMIPEGVSEIELLIDAKIEKGYIAYHFSQ